MCWRKNGAVEIEPWGSSAGVESRLLNGQAEMRMRAERVLDEFQRCSAGAAGRPPAHIEQQEPLRTESNVSVAEGCVEDESTLCWDSFFSAAPSLIGSLPSPYTAPLLKNSEGKPGDN